MGRLSQFSLISLRNFEPRYKFLHRSVSPVQALWSETPLIAFARCRFSLRTGPNKVRRAIGNLPNYAAFRRALLISEEHLLTTCRFGLLGRLRHFICPNQTEGDKMKPLVAGVMLLGLLSGCTGGASSNMAQLQAEVTAAKAVCDARSKAKQIKTAVQWGECQAQAEMHMAPTWGSNADLMLAFQAQRAAILEQLDRGKISPTQATAQIFTLSSSVTSEAQRRSLAAQAVAAQQMQAQANSMQLYNPNFRTKTCTQTAITHTVTCF